MHFDICPVCGDYLGTKINEDRTLSNFCVDEKCEFNNED